MCTCTCAPCAASHSHIHEVYWFGCSLHSALLSLLAGLQGPTFKNKRVKANSHKPISNPPVCFGVSIVSFSYCLLKISSRFLFDIVFEAPYLLHLHLQRDDRLKWLIRFEFLSNRHPIIKALLWGCWLPAVSLSICVGLHYCRTSKPHSNTHPHTYKLPVHTHSFTHIYKEASVSADSWRCLCLLFLQENKETRHQEWRPTHTVFRPAAQWWIKRTNVFYKLCIFKTMCKNNFF